MKFKISLESNKHILPNKCLILLTMSKSDNQKSGKHDIFFLKNTTLDNTLVCTLYKQLYLY